MKNILTVFVIIMLSLTVFAQHAKPTKKDKDSTETTILNRGEICLGWAF